MYLNYRKELRVTPILSTCSAPAASLATAQIALRAALGGTLISHGLKHGRSLEGTAKWFGSIGFRNPKLQARLSAIVEIGAGTAIAMGAVLPLSAATAVGTMAVAARSVHLSNGFFITNEGWEYVMNLAAASVALATIGPGAFSIDHVLGWDHRLSGGSVAALAAAVGLLGAGTQLAVYYRKPAVAIV
ncbi:DoxX family protein [Rhodococcus erythropolis]